MMRPGHSGTPSCRPISSPSTRAPPRRARSCSTPRWRRWRSRSRNSPSISRGPAGSSTTRRRSGRAWSRPCAPRSAEAGVAPADVAAIGITNQRETALIWDRATGKPIHNAIVWQDRRTADMCAALRAAGREPRPHAEDRAAARSLFLGHQDRLAARPRRRRARRRRAGPALLRHGRQLPAVAAHRRQGARDRRHQRGAHAAARHPRMRAGTRSSPTCSACRNRCCPRCATAPATSAPPTCSAAPSASSASPATSRPRRSGRGASRPA